jgi:flagellar hook-associated protein 2
MPTITFGGVGSGIDTESIISGLVAASRGPINRVQLQSTQTQSAVSSMSDIGGLMAKLKESLLALDTVQEVGSFKVESTDKAIVATASGNAQPGSFSLKVSQLASAYKAYSEPLGISQSNQALHQSGTLTLSIGSETANVDIDDGDTLDQVMSKINSSGLRVSASSVFDGTKFRLQLRGLDTGLENDVSVVEAGTSFGFALNEKGRGKDAEFTVDGIEVKSKTNQVQGVLSGVTLALTATTGEAPVTISVSSDATGFEAKLKTLVDSYNAVIGKVNAEAGFGSIKASNPQLSGDSTLRSLTSRMSGTLTRTVGTGKFQTLRSIGIELNNNGTLKLNSTKLQAALAEDSEAVTRVLAGDDKGVAGFADVLAGVTTDLLSANGAITTRREGLTARQRLLTDRQALEQRRLDRMEETLRKQFTQMDQVVSLNQSQMSFLGR